MNVEEAYQAIAQELIEEAGPADWTSIVGTYGVYEKMVSTSVEVFNADAEIDAKGNASFSVASASMEAILFLRDDLLKSTGDRIWSMVFELSSDEKFNIKYGYDKPESFDD